MKQGRVVIDLVAPQSPSYRGRGIARHGLGFTEAMMRGHPELIEAVLVHPDLPPAQGMERMAATGKVTERLDVEAEGGLFHLTSAFEPEVPLRSLWPREASRRHMKLAVTVYDLIPDIFPDMYLMDPGLRRRWRACRETARVADHVFAISQSGTEDVVRLLGVPARRVSDIGAGCDERFVPASDRYGALARARSAIDGLGENFVVYNAAIDPRKNLDRLIEAWSTLPEAARNRWQLVLACRAEPLQRNHYLVMAERLGLAGQVLMPGYLPDPVLVAAYQSADLVVFPSLYEGYGLPVIEAMACGAPVIAADNSSLREIVHPDARFDATDSASMASAITRALTDDSYRRWLTASSARPVPTWDRSADKAAEVYQRLLAPPSARSASLPGWRRHPCLALVLPDAGGTWDLYARRLAGRWREAYGAEVDLYASPGSSSERAGGQVHATVALGRLDRWRGGYDAVVAFQEGESDICQSEHLAAVGDRLVVVAHARAYDTGTPDTGTPDSGTPDDTVKERSLRSAPKQWLATSSEVASADEAALEHAAKAILALCMERNPTWR